jgi:lipopolysaccharide export system protein LptC
MDGLLPSKGPGKGDGRQRLLGLEAPRHRRAPTRASIARRRWMLRITKVILPVFALGLLATLALWPEMGRLSDQERVTFRRLIATDPDTAMMRDARYRGVDDRGRPYTLTASAARQVTADVVNLTDPRGDVTTESGTWFMLQSQKGVFQQHASLLDLSGNVTMYRDDGTRLQCDTATTDLKQGAAASNSQVHAEGPFGTLDAKGWTLADKGNVIQFAGPARLVLNGDQQ